MIKDELIELYVRDLRRLQAEVMLYSSESALWTTAGGISNSGGNLCLHIVGNLKTFIGSAIADIMYTRDRDFEFNGRQVPMDQLCNEIDDLIKIVTRGFGSLTDERFLTEVFPIRIWETATSMSFTIMHLHAHLNYHLGQINYHRRLMDV